MKTITLMWIAAAIVLAQEPQPRKPAPKVTVREGTAPLPTIPAGAKEVGPNLYRYTDAQGKTWMYRRTPFGIGKWEDKPTDQQREVENPIPVTVTDLGDSVQFQRLTPFGPSKWVRKKTELTDDEKAILARQQQSKPSEADSKAADGKAQPNKPPEKP